MADAVSRFLCFMLFKLKKTADTKNRIHRLYLLFFYNPVPCNNVVTVYYFAHIHALWER